MALFQKLRSLSHSSSNAHSSPTTTTPRDANPPSSPPLANDHQRTSKKPSSLSIVPKEHSQSSGIELKEEGDTKAGGGAEEGEGEGEDQESRDFIEFLEKSRREEERQQEELKRKIREAERRKKSVSMSPWAGRM